jgi:S1-C subfamily serine protease
MSNTLIDLSDAIAALVEQSAATTVSVFGRRRLPATGIVWDADLIVTANHVVESDEGLTVEGPSGEAIAATVAGRDPAGDIAVLRAPGLGKSPATRANGVPRPGEYVLAVGKAGDDQPRVSSGLVNLANAALRIGRGRVVGPVIQSEVAMLPGFSGGPLLNSRGEVLGMNSSHLARGASITISVEALAPIVEALATNGRLRTGYIGIGARAVGLTESQVKDAKLDQHVALVVLSIDEGGPAHTAGMLIGDLVVAVNGQPVASVDDLASNLPGEIVGSRIPVHVVRGSAIQEIQITVGERN